MLQINAANAIIIDHVVTPLKVTQNREGTIVYTPESRITGQQYKVHKMPHNRYSTVHPHPASGVAGRDQFEADVKDLLAQLGYAKKGLHYEQTAA